MNRRRTLVIIGVALALVVCGVCAWELAFDVRPRTRLARRLGFGLFEKGANQALDEALRADPASVLSRVEPLLSDPDRSIRILAGQTASEAEAEIRRVALKRASDLVVRELQHAGPDTENWPWVAALLREPNPVDEHLRHAIVGTVRPRREWASEPLAAFLTVARDGSFAAVNRQTAVEVLGGMGEGAAGTLPELKALAAGDPALFGEVVHEAHVRMTPKGTLAWYELMLESADNGFVLCSGFELGAEGRPLGPTVVKFLRDPDWAVRIAAARALGQIDYHEGATELIPLLSDQNDWKLVSAASLVLGQLRNESALAELRRVAQEHWLPRVRDDARRTIAVIDPGLNDAATREQLFPKHAEEARQARVAMPPPPVAEPSFTSSPDELSHWRTRWINRGVDFACYAGHPDEVFEWRYVPSIGVRFAGGFLLGGTEEDGGEFGTGVGFVKAGQMPEYVSGNVKAMHRMPFGVVIVSHPECEGSNSLGSNILLLAEKASDGKCAFRLFKRLPGGAGVSGLLANGNLYIATDGGAVIITRDGEIRLAE